MGAGVYKGILFLKIPGSFEITTFQKWCRIGLNYCRIGAYERTLA